MDVIAAVEENQRDIEWLKGIVGVYGYMLGGEGRRIETFLHGTIGSATWLEGLDDDEWSMLWDEMMPQVFEEAKKRGETLGGQ